MVWKNGPLAIDTHCYWCMDYSGSANTAMDETIPIWSSRMGLAISYLLEISANEKVISYLKQDFVYLSKLLAIRVLEGAKNLNFNRSPFTGFKKLKV